MEILPGVGQRGRAGRGSLGQDDFSCLGEGFHLHQNSTPRGWRGRCREHWVLWFSWGLMLMSLGGSSLESEVLEARGTLMVSIGGSMLQSAPIATGLETEFARGHRQVVIA